VPTTGFGCASAVVTRNGTIGWIGCLSVWRVRGEGNYNVGTFTGCRSMPARLIGILGVAADTIFEIGDEACLSVGRSKDNLVQLADSSVSRRHCCIERRGSQFAVRDLGSLKGTQVNGEAVTERVLVDGDRLSIGSSVLVFATGDSAIPVRPDIPVDFSDEAVTTELSLSVADATYAHPENWNRAPASPRAARDLSVLLSIATRIATIDDEASMLWQLLGMIFDVVPAQRGAIVLPTREMEFFSVAAWNRTGTTVDTLPLIRTVLQQTSQQRSGVLVRSVTADTKLCRIESAVRSQARSVLCVPMIAGDRLLGVIYLDAIDPQIELSDAHLEISMGVAAIASLAMENIRHVAALRVENESLRQELDFRSSLLGNSGGMRALRQLIARVATSDTTVLICGESGTGKELVARSIHDSSNRSEGPFVPINCAALTESLLESELFGHEKGAFTGAIGQKRGHVELAAGGTLFLDEIGELAIGLQAKLLRVLQEREIVRVGGTRPIKVDVRVIAATNRDLTAAIAAGSFRQDLYYRLNVVRVDVPPLRAHRDDIPGLAEHFLQHYSLKCKRRVHGISPTAMQVLTAYDWPGNVRELENAIERAVVLGSADVLHPEDLPDAFWERPTAQPVAAPENYHDALLAFKKQLILNAIAKSDGTLAHAARLLGLHPNYLHRLVTNLELRSELKK
jgi:transcriptional regulator with GAF, ATPase, and Fis domain